MTDALSDVFRANVDAALRWQGLSRYRLADRLGCTPDLVSKTLNNPRGIGVTLATVERYSIALGIDAGTLVTPGGVARARSARMELAS